MKQKDDCKTRKPFKANEDYRSKENSFMCYGPLYKFPYSEVVEGSSIVLYGAGNVAKDYLMQLQRNNHCKVLCIADRDYERIGSLSGIEVVAPEFLLSSDSYDTVVVSSWWHVDSIMVNLKRMRIPETKIVSQFPCGMHSYTICGEDIAVYTIFRLLGRDTFSYIDVGANDPYKGSNTAYLYANGCRGICVEANPDMIESLKQERPEDIVISAGVGPTQGIKTYYCYENNVCNTFSAEFAKKHVAAGRHLKETREVKVMTMQEIISDYSDNAWPDFLQIDIEGLDYEVLSDCDFSQTAPSVICAEVLEPDKEKMNLSLKQKGFLPFYRTDQNTIFIRQGLFDGHCLV
jgi:FkbM family methyltransferase